VYLSRTIRCSAIDTLPGRASGVTPGCEALGTTEPRSERTGCGPVRGNSDYQPHGGREQGLKGKANSGESPLSRRHGKQAKEAVRLGPKGMWPGRGAPMSPLADVVPPADRRGLCPSEVVRVWNVVSPIVPTGMWTAAREGVPVDEGVWDAGASEGRAVMVRIGVLTLPHPERGLTSGGSWITRKVRKGSTTVVTDRR
jgi:hypothetical protein